MYTYAQRILGLYNEVDNQVRTLTGEVTGPLAVGASTSIAEYLIPSLLGEFQAKHLDVQLRLNVANTVGIIHMVENSEIDIGIVEGPIGRQKPRGESLLAR